MSRESSVVIGIDPGTAITGFGVLATSGPDLRALDYGVIRTSSNDPLQRRLVILYDELTSLFARHQPQAIAVEELFFAKNARTALTVGHARGVVLLAVAQTGAHFAQFKPSEVKQAVTGYGAADKKQMQDMVRLLLGLEETPQPDDAADALAVAICYQNSAALQQLYVG
ncbi:MAG: crossover junction endodeoxyribonuclease RuvC [Caldilineales bacterium]|nr:crossover junction endodeoxyribonuclease RuvC [Caldilineales bacterium]